MGKWRLLLTLATCFGLLVESPAAAGRVRFELDPDATSISIHFGATLHFVNGSLRVEEGAIEVDLESNEASGRVVLDATSADTGNESRDRKMHADILETLKFPQMVFEVERLGGVLNRTGRSDLQLHGTLHMHGVARPFELAATAVVEGDRVVASGRVIVPYLEWGIDDPSVFLLRVQKKVYVQVTAQGTVVDLPVAGAALKP